MDTEFGPAYSGTLARDQVLRGVGGRTVVQALADGVPPRTVWQAVCDAMDVPPERRWGADRGARGRPA